MIVVKVVMLAAIPAVLAIGGWFIYAMRKADREAWRRIMRVGVLAHYGISEAAGLSRCQGVWDRETNTVEFPLSVVDLHYVRRITYLDGKEIPSLPPLQLKSTLPKTRKKKPEYVVVRHQGGRHIGMRRSRAESQLDKVEIVEEGFPDSESAAERSFQLDNPDWEPTADES